jgi:hypothetical protein
MKGGIVGVFQTLDATLAAIRRLQEGGIRPTKVYSPTRVEEITNLLGMKPSPVRYFTLVGGITGILFGFGLATFAAGRWGFIVWGKHPAVFLPYVIPAFEFCILFAVLATLIGMAIHIRIPRFSLPEEYDRRFSRDLFGIAVRTGEEGKAKISEILSGAGAVEVREF